MISVNTKKLVDAIKEADVYTLPDMNEGTGYLYNNLYKRLSNGEDVTLSSLDFDAFEHEDIISLNSLYSELFGRNNSVAGGIMSMLRKAAPVCRVVVYV
jgi:hypothetical protein